VEVLEKLHGNGLVHRDVKPSNILVADEDHCLLIDFGQCVALPTHYKEHYGTSDFRSFRSLTMPHRAVDDWISLAVTLQWFASKRHHHKGGRLCFYEEAKPWMRGLLPLLVDADDESSTEADWERLRKYLRSEAVAVGVGAVGVGAVGVGQWELGRR